MNISICIPAYGRQAQINELISSIASAARHSVGIWRKIEVIVSDNASSPSIFLPSIDDLAGFETRLIRQNTNIGAAKNFIAVALAATGDYCWWMGSDDTIQQDAFTQIHRQITEFENAQLWVFDRLDWHPIANKLSRRSWYRNIPPRSIFDLSRDEEILKFANASLGIGGLFSFLGSLVFKRNFFCLSNIPDRIYGTAYPHVYILLRKRPRLVCNLAPLVKCRLGDDSFSGKSALSRLLLDIDGYSTLLDSLAWTELLKASFAGAVGRELVDNYLKTAANTFNLFIRSSSEDVVKMRKWFASQQHLPVAIRFIGYLPNCMFTIARLFRNSLKLVSGKFKQ